MLSGASSHTQGIYGVIVFCSSCRRLHPAAQPSEESGHAVFQLNRTLSIYDRFAIGRSIRQLLRSLLAAQHKISYRFQVRPALN